MRYDHYGACRTAQGEPQRAIIRDGVVLLSRVFRMSGGEKIKKFVGCEYTHLRETDKINLALERVIL
jgi:hypothetical protein